MCLPALRNQTINVLTEWKAVCKNLRDVRFSFAESQSLTDSQSLQRLTIQTSLFSLQFVPQGRALSRATGQLESCCPSLRFLPVSTNEGEMVTRTRKGCRTAYKHGKVKVCPLLPKGTCTSYDEHVQLRSSRNQAREKDSEAALLDKLPLLTGPRAHAPHSSPN